MGYRSDVRMIISGPKDELLAAFTSFALGGMPKEWLDEFIVADDGPGRAVAILGHGGTDWKWYYDYEDVQAYERIWDHFQERDDIFSGAFTRVGEDFEDVERRYFGSYGTELAWTSSQIVSEYDDHSLVDIRHSPA